MSNLMKQTEQKEQYIIPQVDTCEYDNEYRLTIDMPGAGKNDIDIHLEDEVLTITGTISEDSNTKYLYKEFNSHSYKRSFRVGRDINRDTIHAKMDQGVLILTLPKAEKLKPRKIQIEGDH